MEPNHSFQEDAFAPVAVIGLAFEFPQGATSDEAFWKMLCQGRCASTEFPPDRLNIDSLYHPDETRPSSLPLRGGHFVEENLGAFDAPFFSITPTEAAFMDPQHRRLLETAYHAFEDAGLSICKLSGSNTSVYTGCFTNDYLSILQQDHQAEQGHGAVGIAQSMLANRLSWFFNLKGASMNLDCACSSSLVALHLACQDLRTGTSSMALVGGANLVFHPAFMKILSSFNFLSKDSRCWSFDERANGYARGEGMAVLIVKLVKDALRDGDTIRAVVRNTGLSQDGRTPSITLPNQQSQIELIEKTFAQAQIEMEPTRFFEAHGTGTRVGDPLEANAIGHVFRDYRSNLDPLYIGAVKANIGHLEGCSGLAGLIKTILVLENAAIPPISGLESLNKRIDAKKLHLEFPTKVVPWPQCNVRRACVNSFGFGGSNAVAILDDAYHFMKLNGLDGFHRTRAVAPAENGFCETPIKSLKNNGFLDQTTHLPKMLVCSAPDQAGTLRISQDYEKYICKIEDSEMADLAYSLAARRSWFSWRCFSISNPQGKAEDRQPLFTAPIKADSKVHMAFVFTGQGAQYLGMGAGLLAYPVFRQSIVKSDEHLASLGCCWSVLDSMADTDSKADMNNAEVSQTMTACLQIALVDLISSLGITPSVVMGHSSGEIAAAYAAGALSHLSAVKAAYFRGVVSWRLACQTPGLTMMAVGLSKERIAPYLERLEEANGAVHVEIGCINSPSSVTLTGTSSQLTQLEEWMRQHRVYTRRLRVSMAYHSRFMGVMADGYADLMGHLDKSRVSKSVPMISSVTGQVVGAQTLATAAYWVKNMTCPVDFVAALDTLVAEPCGQLGKHCQEKPTISHILEIGPHSTLGTAICECVQSFASPNKPQYHASLSRGKDAHLALLQALGALWCAGYPVNILQANRLDESIQRRLAKDMPHYPFNHEHKYWAESRLSTNFRFPEVPRHDLLGARSLDWNPHVAQWRNVMRLDELPWLKHHAINGEIVFPAAGYIVMAMEGLKQVAASQEALEGIHIRDVVFSHAIQFPQGVEQVETQLTLFNEPQRPVADLSRWSRFRVFVIDNGSYLECCSGHIKAVVEERHGDGVAFSGPWSSRDWFQHISDACLSDDQNGYNNTSRERLSGYGQASRGLSRIRLGNNGEAVAQLKTDGWLASSDACFGPVYSIHPAAMACLLQLAEHTMSKLNANIGTMLPVRVSSIWVGCRNKALTCGSLSIFGQSQLRGSRLALIDVAGTAQGSSRPVVYLQGVQATLMNKDSEPRPRRLCTRLVWKPDVDMMSQHELFRHCTAHRPCQEADEVEAYQRLTLAIMVFIEEALLFVEGEKMYSKLEPHIQAFVEWMKYQQGRLCNGEMVFDYKRVQVLVEDAEERERLVSQVESHRVDGRFLMLVGRNLMSILRGQVDGLHLIFHSGLVEEYYQQILANAHVAYPCSRYVDLASFKNPSMKIIEIGAGTGGQTLGLLKAMSSDGVMNWERYDFTDVSASFFGHARANLGEYGAKVAFKVFDISKDPATQCLEAATYDMVVASHVVHVTRRLGQALRHLRRLLKAGGKLLLFETTRPDVPTAFASGLFRDWWKPLQDETRSPHSPCLSVEQWHDELERSGFSGVDLEIPGQAEEATRFSSFMVSTAVEARGEECAEKRDSRRHVKLVVDERVEAQGEIAGLVREQLFARGIACSQASLGQLAKQTATRVERTTVFLLELDSIFLDSMCESEYEELQAVLVREATVVWVTRRASRGASEPRHGLADGLGRALMSEDWTRKFVTLSLDAWHGGKVAQVVCEVAQRVGDTPVDRLETAHVGRDGTLVVGRVVPDAAMDAVVAQAMLSRQVSRVALADGRRMALSMEEQGDTCGWSEAEDEQHGEPLAADEVEVRVCAICLLNRGCCRGSQAVALTCAGSVERAGEASGFQAGQRLCLVSPSAAATVVRVRAKAAARFPSAWTFAEAACMASALWTAYHALVRVARVEPGERVLVHPGASFEGQVMVQVAQALGAKVFASAASAQERDELAQELRLSPGAILVGSSADAVDVLVGHGQGDDFVQCVAPLGRLVDTCAKQSTAAAAKANVSATRVDMAELLASKSGVAYQCFEKAMGMMMMMIKVPQQQHLGVFAAGEAHLAQGQDVAGKAAVVELKPEMVVMASIKTKAKCSFPAEATYIIAGGLGGLGRSFARWMASRGARHLILLSRFGAHTAAAQALVSQLESQGVCVKTPAVDVGHLQRLREVLGQLGASMPPIRGCIQAACLLRDNLFANMTYDDWTASTRAKVAASWNLHATMPANVDFLVLTSSLNGIIGCPGQANYAAGNTFADALAQHRVAHGQKAISIDLGLMATEGMLAEKKHLMASMRRLGHLMEIQQEELLALLDYYCDARLPLLKPSEAQILVGIETPQAVAAKGMDLHHAMQRPMFGHLLQMGKTRDAHGDAAATTASISSDARAAQLAAASSHTEAAALVTRWLAAKMAQLLLLPADQVDVAKPAHAYGIDSLIAIDLTKWFVKELGADVAVCEVLGEAALRDLADAAARASVYRRPAAKSRASL
ncbi:hypothetical protein CDD82_2127 [Ophiocordyceps australis]|uniref:Uncharacterized protein n=1 Tax=Ophiocordyceps australis TaxID=1399860 RepID=A0A2C5ZJ35_9HYPO|nr:hypothetical protein CDD82_2127 [Ophiocordyceps australis]